MAGATPPEPSAEPDEGGRFQRDVAWNFASTAVLAVGGFAMIGLLGALHGPAGLGVFSQVWAPYVLFSQLAVGGLDRSVLRALAERVVPRAERGPLVWSALLPAVASSGLFALAFWLARDAMAEWYSSPSVARGVQAAAPGLFCFGVNKVLLGVVNGLRRMRAFALYQSLRYLLMPLGVLVAHWSGLEASQSAFLFTFAEGTLLAVLLVELLSQVPLPRLGWLSHVRDHASYGLRSVASGVLLELNSRVDVWMLGHFRGDVAVGLYTAALQVAEGVFQLLIALQNNYNPVLARHLATRRFAELEELVRRGGRKTFAGMALVSAIAVLGFPVAVRLLFASDEFAASWLPFGVLMAGIWLSSLRMPFFQTLLMAGRPGWNSLFMVAVVLVNVVGNALLIPRLGIVGAALGTAISFVASVVILKAAVRALLGVRI